MKTSTNNLTKKVHQDRIAIIIAQKILAAQTRAAAFLNHKINKLPKRSQQRWFYVTGFLAVTWLIASVVSGPGNQSYTVIQPYIPVYIGQPQRHEKHGSEHLLKDSLNQKSKLYEKSKFQGR